MKFYINNNTRCYRMGLLIVPFIIDCLSFLCSTVNQVLHFYINWFQIKQNTQHLRTHDGRNTLNYYKI